MDAKAEWSKKYKQIIVIWSINSEEYDESLESRGNGHDFSL